MLNLDTQLLKKFYLSFYFACTKLEYYVFLKQVFMVWKINLIKYFLNWSTLQGRLMKWALKLSA